MKKKGLIVLGGFALAMSLMQPLTSYADDVIEDVVESEEVSDSQVEGVMREGWQQDGDYLYYYENGEMVRDCMKVIDGYTYGFATSGIMLVNSGYAFPGYGDDLHWFDEYGHLRINSWQVTEYGSRFYYDELGRVVDGIVEIEGDYYWLRSSDGAMVSNNYGLDEQTLKLYFFGSDGKATKSAQCKEGWNKFDNHWFYVRNGKLVTEDWVKDSNSWYYFDFMGCMLQDTTYMSYRFDKNGRMVTGWYIIEQRFDHTAIMKERYYYLPSGKAAEGLTTVDGDTYLFIGGRMFGGITQYGKELIKTSSEGRLLKKITLKEGWNDFDGGRYYVANGTLVRNQWLEIDGYKYYFGASGFAYNSIPVTINGYCYAFDKDGHMLTGWQKTEGNTYYFQADGRSITNNTTTYVVKRIDGKDYYFHGNGRLLYVSSIEIDGKLYKSDVDGSLIPYSSKTSGWVNEYFYMQDGKLVIGWKKIDGAYYYFTENGKQKGMVNIDGEQYYFDQFGKMQTGWVYCWDRWFWAESSGKIARDGWKKINNTWYYFSGNSYLTGMQPIDGEWNLFDANGKWVRAVTEKNKWISANGNYYYADANGQILTGQFRTENGKTYFFNFDGTMAKNCACWFEGSAYYFGSDGVMVKNKWIASEDYLGRWCYYGSDGANVEGWQKINKKWYYFDSRGCVTGDVEIDGLIYHFDDNGVWDGKSGLKTSGWYKMNGLWYYGGEAKELGNGWKMIGSTLYYFNYDGDMHTEGIYRAYDGNYYYIDSVGKVRTNGWYKAFEGYQGYSWCYAGKSGALVQGLQTIDGKQYYFTPRMITHDCISEDAKTIYQIDSSGVVTKLIGASGTKWVKTESGNWFYSKNGKFVTGYEVIDGKGYYFDSFGRMVKNKIVDGYGFFDSKGELSLREGWAKENGEWYYLKNGSRDGYAENPITVIGISGKTYIGRYGSGEIVSGVARDNGSYYYFDVNTGSRTKLSFKEGWNKYNGEWYYLRDGYLLNGVVNIGNKWYCFNEYKMMTNQPYYIYWNAINKLVYFGADGELVKNTWAKVNGVWAYFDANGYALVGEHIVDGKKYNFYQYSY